MFDRERILRADPNKIYIRELCEIVDRSYDRVRNWVQMGILPERLMPDKGLYGSRVWTPDQVDGILEWMQRHDMRKNRVLSAPENDERDRLVGTKPRLINFKILVKIRKMVVRQYSRWQIVEALFPEVTYTTKEAFDKAIVNCCKYEGFFVPPKYIEHSDLMSARSRQALGQSLQEIINALYRRTEYTDALELEGDLVRAYQLRDWPLPHSDPSVKLVDKFTRQQRAEIKRLEKQVRAIENLLEN